MLGIKKLNFQSIELHRVKFLHLCNESPPSPMAREAGFKLTMKEL